MSLRVKLLIFSIILALIPLGISGMSMIQRTRDEMKSSVQDNLMLVAGSVVRELEDMRGNWLTVLRMIKKTVESEELGINEKLSLLTEGLKGDTDFVALQIAVEGIRDPLLATQDEFSKKLILASADPAEQLKITPEKIVSLKGDASEFVGDLSYLPGCDAWLLTVILDMAPLAGRHATLSARIDLSRLKKRIANHPFNESGSITLLDSRGNNVTGKKKQGSMTGLLETAKKLFESASNTIVIGSDIRPSGEKMLGVFAMVKRPDLWVIVEKTESSAYKTVSQMENYLVLWVIIGFIVAVLGAVVLSISLTRPLRRLTSATKTISEGDFSVGIEIGRQKDEIGELAVAFQKMLEELRDYIERLTETTKAKERVESELQLAKDIQQSFLPKSFPVFDEIDVWGKCFPAREVGGDYFDFFPIDEKKYGMVIGDVAGKGVPAALFMAVSRTLFRILTLNDRSPEQVLMEFNDQLVSLDQGSNMFITVFYGVYDIETGLFRYSTAGHNMPYIASNRNASKGFYMLPSMKTMVAGMIEGMEMESAEEHLKKGDVVVLYTDGMTEAINSEGEEFGEDRLQELLNKNRGLTASDLTETLIDHVLRFQEGMPQFDDMTVFILKVK